MPPFSRPRPVRPEFHQQFDEELSELKKEIITTGGKKIISPEKFENIARKIERNDRLDGINNEFEFDIPDEKSNGQVDIVGYLKHYMRQEGVSIEEPAPVIKNTLEINGHSFDGTAIDALNEDLKTNPRLSFVSIKTVFDEYFMDLFISEKGHVNEYESRPLRQALMKRVPHLAKGATPRRLERQWDRYEQMLMEKKAHWAQYADAFWHGDDVVEVADDNLVPGGAEGRIYFAKMQALQFTMNEESVYGGNTAIFADGSVNPEELSKATTYEHLKPRIQGQYSKYRGIVERTKNVTGREFLPDYYVELEKLAKLPRPYTAADKTKAQDLLSQVRMRDDFYVPLEEHIGLLAYDNWERPKISSLKQVAEAFQEIVGGTLGAMIGASLLRMVRGYPKDSRTDPMKIGMTKSFWTMFALFGVGETQFGLVSKGLTVARKSTEDAIGFGAQGFNAIAALGHGVLLSPDWDRTHISGAYIKSAALGGKDTSDWRDTEKFFGPGYLVQIEKGSEILHIPNPFLKLNRPDQVIHENRINQEIANLRKNLGNAANLDRAEQLVKFTKLMKKKTLTMEEYKALMGDQDLMSDLGKKDLLHKSQIERFHAINAARKSGDMSLVLHERDFLVWMMKEIKNGGGLSVQGDEGLVERHESKYWGNIYDICWSHLEAMDQTLIDNKKPSFLDGRSVSEYVANRKDLDNPYNQKYKDATGLEQPEGKRNGNDLACGIREFKFRHGRARQHADLHEKTNKGSVLASLFNPSKLILGGITTAWGITAYIEGLNKLFGQGSKITGFFKYFAGFFNAPIGIVNFVNSLFRVPERKDPAKGKEKRTNLHRAPASAGQLRSLGNHVFPPEWYSAGPLRKPNIEKFKKEIDLKKLDDTFRKEGFGIPNKEIKFGSGHQKINGLDFSNHFKTFNNLLKKAVSAKKEDRNTTMKGLYQAYLMGLKNIPGGANEKSYAEEYEKKFGPMHHGVAEVVAHAQNKDIKSMTLTLKQSGAKNDLKLNLDFSKGTNRKSFESLWKQKIDDRYDKDKAVSFKAQVDGEDEFTTCQLSYDKDVWTLKQGKKKHRLKEESGITIDTVEE